jgi:copper(I)-binding protein
MNLATRFLLPAAFAAALFAAAAGASAQITVEGAWARPTVAGQAAGGGFLTIVNRGAADRLVGASTPAAARVELHTMSMEGDVMRMREVPAIDVPANGRVSLAPGGLHLMFMQPKAPLATGSTLPLVLRFEKAGEVAVQVAVQPRAPAGAAAGHGGHGGHKH